MCSSCGYNIREHYHHPYLEYLYKKLKEALDIQEGYRRRQDEGELSKSQMIRQWGKEAMRIQSIIQKSRDDPDEFTWDSHNWMEREKIVNAPIEAIRKAHPEIYGDSSEPSF